ncbi:nuclear cap-binding protein subunit 3-like isoform X1 [Amphibalanus amphitrite]|uniref:nuclear cap-binding protein subunit 3-like isoform X1 n=1 Tax=Amphibalanus amphitrite TaxID=1232801 RepID=UPI001C8FB6C1|nr:nuclear cap-binding protein subunit 3-like isoform X1 [Amphibalanus amphitrite]
MDTEPLDVDPELDYEDGLLGDDNDSPPPAGDHELEDGELDDSGSEQEAAPAGRPAAPPEPLTEEARRRRAERFGGMLDAEPPTEEARRRRVERFGEMQDAEPPTAETRRRRAERFGDMLDMDAEPVTEEARRRRAERFGETLAPADPPGLPPAEQARRSALYASLGLSEPVDGPVQWRPEAVHVRGTGTMTTGDVMDYFYRFRPAHVEWVTDGACNVVWMDDVGPVRALLELSSPIAPPGAERPAAAAVEEDPDALLVGLDTMDSDAPPPPAADTHMREAGEEEAVDPADIKTPIPPGRWRLGVPHRLTDSLFLRFATRGDRRLPGAEQSRSGHVKLLGDPSHPAGVAGIITERRRRELRGEPVQEAPPPPGKVNPWGGIAASWATAEAVRRPVRDYDHDPELNLLRDGGRPPDLRRRLESRPAGAGSDTERPTAPQPRKRQRSSSPESGGDAAANSDEEEWRTRLKVPRMRMHADDELEKPVTARRPVRSDLRARLAAGGGRWRKNAELEAERREAPDGRRRQQPASPLRLDYEQPDAEDEDELTASAGDLDSERPVNIKITRDFSGDELSGGESSSETSESAPDSDREDEEDEDEEEEEVEPVEVDVDRRTDKNSAADLRARLNKKRAETKSERPPLRIEVDNDEYYRLIGSDSE